MIEKGSALFIFSEANYLFKINRLKLNKSTIMPQHKTF